MKNKKKYFKMLSTAVVIAALRVKGNQADDNFFYFYFYFSKKTSLDISCESSAKQTIHMKYQDLFSSKNKKKYFKMSSAAVVIGTFRVKGNQAP